MPRTIPPRPPLQDPETEATKTAALIGFAVFLAGSAIMLYFAFWRTPQQEASASQPLAEKIRDKVVDKAIDKAIDKTEDELRKAMDRIAELERKNRETARSEPSRRSEPEPVRRDPPPEPRREPAKLSADIVVGYVSVESTKENGWDWDVGGGYPDLKVYVGHDYLLAGTSAWTSVKWDTLSATFNEKTIRVTEGERIKIQVWDQDALDDDQIGEYVKEITAETLRQGSVTWTVGRAEVTIKFEY